ncbi:hypothetical protein D3C76_1655920 [compost metagenome]|uniref:Uncharacterized protein n=1 Tax=Serratia liquefaciens TaxID=614 RepID=A0ABX7DBC7_SERLI|nr:hypothetical protein [Serratia liquefaciens]QQU58030.1 hypothetical protein I6I38_24975 [Serratia liquefaciens]
MLQEAPILVAGFPPLPTNYLTYKVAIDCYFQFMWVDENGMQVDGDDVGLFAGNLGLIPVLVAANVG